MSGIAPDDHAAAAPAAGWRAMVRSFGVLAAGEGVARVLSFVAIVWMTRQLSLDEFGLVALGGNLVLWFAVTVNSSTQTIGLRDVSREPHRFKEILEPLLGVRLALSLAAIVVFAVTAAVVGSDAEDRLVLLLFALALPALSINLRFSLLALGAATTVATANVVSQLLFAAGVLLLVTGPGDAIFVPLAQALGELAFALIVLARVAPRFGLIRPRVDAGVWREHARESAPLVATQTGRATISWFDSLLIALVLGQAQVGLYSAAYRPVLFLSYSLSLLFVSFLAAYTAAPAGDRDVLLVRTFRLAAALGISVAVAVGVGAGPLVELLFGARYAGAAVSLAILAWSVPLLAIGSVFTMVLVSHGRQSAVMRHTAVGVVLNVVANLVAVPTVGIEGAAAITVLAWMVIAVLNHRTCMRLGYAPPLSELLGARAVKPAQL